MQVWVLQKDQIFGETLDQCLDKDIVESLEDHGTMKMHLNKTLEISLEDHYEAFPTVIHAKNPERCF